MKPPEVTYTEAYLNIFTVLLYLSVLVGLFIIYWGAMGIWHQYELDTDSTYVEGIVTQHYSSTDSDNNDTYSLDYSYKDEAEHHFNGSINVNESEWDGLSKGDKLQVAYSNKDHSVSGVPGSNSWMGLVELVLGTVWAVVSWVNVGAIIQKGLKRVEIFQKGMGVVVQTDVEMVEEKDSDGDKKLAYYLTYSYQDQGGEKFRGRSSVTEAEFKRWKKSIEDGDKNLNLFYNPIHPRDHMISVSQDKAVLGTIELEKKLDLTAKPV